MVKDKTSFVLYNDLIHTVDKLSDARAGKLLKIILHYVNDKNPPEPTDKITQIAFEPIKHQLTRDLKKWEKYIQKQSENGKRGGRPLKGKQLKTEKTKTFFEEPKKTESVSVTVNDSVIKRENSGAPDLKNSNLFRKPVIPTKDEVLKAITDAGGTMQMAKSFYEKYESTGWYINGSPVVNYKALASRFVSNWNDHDKKESNQIPAGPNLKMLP